MALGSMPYLQESLGQAGKRLSVTFLQRDAMAWYRATDAGLGQYQCRQCRHFGKLSTEFSLGTFRICLH